MDFQKVNIHLVHSVASSSNKQWQKTCKRFKYPCWALMNRRSEMCVCVRSYQCCVRLVGDNFENCCSWTGFNYVLYLFSMDFCSLPLVLSFSPHIYSVQTLPMNWTLFFIKSFFLFIQGKTIEKWCALSLYLEHGIRFEIEFRVVWYYWKWKDKTKERKMEIKQENKRENCWVRNVSLVTMFFSSQTMANNCFLLSHSTEHEKKNNIRSIFTWIRIQDFCLLFCRCLNSFIIHWLAIFLFLFLCALFFLFYY